MSTAAPSQRSRVKRLPDRGSYERQQIYDILDEGLVAHVGIVQDGLPIVIPMGYARMGDKLLLHGSLSSRLMKVETSSHHHSYPLWPRCLTDLYSSVNSQFCLQEMKAGADICVTVTLLDGLVLARSVFHHSMNYRSVVLFGHTQVTLSTCLVNMTINCCCFLKAHMLVCVALVMLKVLNKSLHTNRLSL